MPYPPRKEKRRKKEAETRAHTHTHTHTHTLTYGCLRLCICQPSREEKQTPFIFSTLGVHSILFSVSSVSLNHHTPLCVSVIDSSHMESAYDYIQRKTGPLLTPRGMFDGTHAYKSPVFLCKQSFIVCVIGNNCVFTNLNIASSYQHFDSCLVLIASQ